MKKNDRIQLKNAGIPELEKRVNEAQEKLAQLAHEVEAGKVKNVHEGRSLRKDVARMLTEIAVKKNQK